MNRCCCTNRSNRAILKHTSLLVAYIPKEIAIPTMAAFSSEGASSLVFLLLVVLVSEWIMIARSEFPSPGVESKDLTRNRSTKLLPGLRSTKDLTTPAITSEVDDGIKNSSRVRDIWLLGLFPLKGSWPGGLGQLPAVKLGIQHVNDNPNILPGYRLRMTVNDTEVRLTALYPIGYNPIITIPVKTLYLPPSLCLTRLLL